MASYYARVPLAGYVEIRIDSDHTPGTPEFETQLWDLIFQQLEEAGELFNPRTGIVEQWSLEPYKQITEGNFCYAELNEMEIEEEDN